MKTTTKLNTDLKTKKKKPCPYCAFYKVRHQVCPYCHPEYYSGKIHYSQRY